MIKDKEENYPSFQSLYLLDISTPGFQTQNFGLFESEPLHLARLNPIRGGGGGILGAPTSNILAPARVHTASSCI